MFPPLHLKLSTGLVSRLLNVPAKVAFQMGIAPQVTFVIKSESYDKRGKNILGFGVCCVFTASACGSTIANNCTYIQNPNYPSSESSGSCEYKVTPVSTDVCQLRLDFQTFDITEKTSDNAGTCIDSFDITSGSSRTYSTLCGTLTSQHSMDIFHSLTKEISLTFHFSLRRDRPENFLANAVIHHFYFNNHCYLADQSQPDQLLELLQVSASLHT